MAGWEGQIPRGEFRASGASLADWLALRQIDLTGMQVPLQRLGLSSLGRMEAHLAAFLQAVTVALHVVAATAFLRGIPARMDRHKTKKTLRRGVLGVWAGFQS